MGYSAPFNVGAFAANKKRILGDLALRCVRMYITHRDWRRSAPVHIEPPFWARADNRRPVKSTAQIRRFYGFRRLWQFLEDRDLAGAG